MGQIFLLTSSKDTVKTSDITENHYVKRMNIDNTYLSVY